MRLILPLLCLQPAQESLVSNHLGIHLGMHQAGSTTNGSEVEDTMDLKGSVGMCVPEDL